MKKSPATPTLSPAPERGVWLPFPSGWRQVHGSFHRAGVSVETHDIQPRSDFDWAPSFHPGSVEICLNVEGHAWLEAGVRVHLGPAQSVIYSCGGQPLRAVRMSGGRHRFVTVEMSIPFLRQRLADCGGPLLPFVLEAVRTGSLTSAVSESRHFTAAQSASVRAAFHPPVAPGARALWYEAKIVEWLAETVFSEEGDLFCHRQQRIERERVEKVKAILAASLEYPPGLHDLARRAGVSAFYLSRTFSRVTGETIPEFLRRLRIERAAAMLSAGTHNVTEAAFAVGYNSLGHFSRSFAAVFGLNPASYARRHGARP